MSVCGVPTLSWPYACDIDEANSLKFDAGTGRLWVKPETPTYTYESTMSFVAIPGAAEIAPVSSSEALRIWWAGCVADFGQNATFDLSSLASVTHTNTTCHTQQVRAYAMMPSVRWMNAFLAMKCQVGIRGRIDGVQSGLAVSVSHDAELGDPWIVSGAGPFGDPYPELEAFEGIIDSPTASFHYRSMAHMTDLWAGWNAVLPGASITLDARLIARTGPIPVDDVPYYKSYADVLTGAGSRFVVEVVTTG